MEPADPPVGCEGCALALCLELEVEALRFARSAAESLDCVICLSTLEDREVCARQTARLKWREELGPTDKFGLNHLEMIAYWSEAGFLFDLKSHLQELEDVVQHALTESKKKASEAVNRVPKLRPGVMDAEAPEFAAAELWNHDAQQLRQRLRVLRIGLFLAAYAQFEQIVVKVAEQGSGLSAPRPRVSTATNALKRLSSPLRQAFLDVDDLRRRTKELQDLRNELTHRAGFVLGRTEEKLDPLIARGEILIEYEEHAPVVEFANDFLANAFEDLYRTALAVLRLSDGSLAWQLDEEDA